MVMAIMYSAYYNYPSGNKLEKASNSSMKKTFFTVYDYLSSKKLKDADSYPSMKKRVFPVTLVTAYYSLSKSKHSHSDYQQWIENFLGHIENPVVVFTDKQSESHIRSVRAEMGPLRVVLMDLKETEPVKKYGKVWEKQHSIDPERQRHSPQLYAIWDTKPWFLNRVAAENPFNSSYFFWVDIGCFREKGHSYRKWPNVSRINSVLQNRDKMVLGKIHSFTEDDWKKARKRELITKDRIQGTFFGGRAPVLLRYMNLFYDFIDECIGKGWFVGKEQNMMNTLALMNHNSTLVIDASRSNVKTCGDPWFYFQPFLAAKDELPSSCKLLE